MAQLPKAVGNIAGAFLLQFVDGVRVPPDEIGRNPGRMFGGHRPHSGNLQLDELPAAFRLWGAAGRKNDVTRILNRAQDGSDDVWSRHESAGFRLLWGLLLAGFHIRVSYAGP